MKVLMMLHLFATTVAIGWAATNDLPSTITIDGETFEQIQWGKATLSDVSISHSKGVASLPLSKLPTELQNHFQYDPKRAADFQATNDMRVAFFKETKGMMLLKGQLVRVSDYSPRKIKGWVTGAGTLQDYSVTGTMVDIGIPRRIETAEQMEYLRELRRYDRPGERNLLAERYADSWMKEHNAAGKSNMLSMAGFDRGGTAVLLLNWVTPQPVGSIVEFEGYQVNPIGGMQTYTRPNQITFEYWNSNRHLFQSK